MNNYLLYLEDDEPLARVTIRALQKKGFLVDHFDNLTGLREALTRRQYRYGLLDESQKGLDYVLALQPSDFLERRLQTLVFKLGHAKSIHHARILIRQRHIRCGFIIFCITHDRSCSTFLKLAHCKSLGQSYGLAQ